VALAALIFILLLCIRRWRKRDEDQNDFSPDNFRRSAVLMDDPPTHSDTINRGYNPRPPTMIERKLANASPAYLRQQQQQQFAQQPYAYPGYGQGPGGYEGQQQPYYNSSFGPGQVMPVEPFYPVPNSVDPLHAPTAHGAEQAQLGRQPSNPAYLTRQPSGAMPLTRQPSTGVSAQAHYMDLNRSSITPFQAAQYADISRQLNTEVPGPMPDIPTLHTVPEEPVAGDPVYHGEEPLHSYVVDGPLPPTPVHDSPFADPAAQHSETDVAIGIATSGDDLAPPDLALPDPAHTHTHARVDSNPPMLPEISLPQRPFSPGFSSRGSYSLPTSVTGKPSPSSSPAQLSAEFGGISAPPAAAKAFQSSPLAAAGDRAELPMALRAGNEGEGERKRPDTVYTVYDPEDAYGGI